MVHKNKNLFSNMDKSQYLNYLAIELLEKMGNPYPSQKQIDFTESLLATYSARLLQQ